MRFLNKTVVAFICTALSINLYASTEIDKETGLKIATGFEEVKTNCTVCHSAAFIVHQKGDRDTWHAMIKWMQKTQGLWEFDKETEDKILTYLSTNYPPGKAGRRDNLKTSLMPPNPYK
ncbi:MAG: hypothetical protein AB1389_10360 [Campylobacterota bacterium]